MAQQIKVNSSTGNIQISISRGAIGPSTTANTANTAYNLDAASTANVIIGGGVANYVLQTDGAGNTSWVAQTGGGATNPAGANTQVQFNDQGSFGAESNFTYDKATDVLTADHFSGEGGNLSNIQGANISGTVANATHATSADSANAVAGANVTGEVAFAATANAVAGANVSGEVAFAAVANSVAVANVAGIGNIATTNLDGNSANYLDGTGSWGPVSGGGGTPGGSNTQVQYNDNGAFAGEAGFEYDDVTNTLTAENIVATGEFFGDLDGAVSANVQNDTASTLSKGDAVYLTGGNTGDNPHVDLADADDATKMPALGIVKENITAGSVGQVITSGVMNDSSHGYTAGADLYVSTTPGALTTTKPTGEANLIQKIGKVVSPNHIIVQGAFRTNQTPNLDDGNIFIGNATNESTTAILNTTIVPEGTNEYYTNARVNSHLAAFGSNTITTTGNVETGNLTATTSLFVDGVDGNVLIQPNVALNGKTYSSVVRGEYNTGTGNSTTSQAIVTDNYTTQGITEIQSFANTAAGALAKGPSFGFNNYAAIGNTSTDPLVAGQIDFTAYSDGANLANATTSTGTTLTMGGAGTDGFLIVQGTNSGDTYGSEVWKQFQYRPKSMGFIRRNGNADSRSASTADDETSLNFYNTQEQGGAGTSNLWNYPAKMGAKVDPTWVDPQNGSLGIPQGFSFTCVDEAFANLEHRMFGNGQVTFNYAGGGTPITLGKNGVITGDGGGLSNISTTAGSQIVNGTSNVDIATSGANVTVGVNGTADMLVISDAGANVKNKVFIDNADGNVLLDPNVAFNSDTFTNITRGEYDSGTSLSSLNTAIVTDNYAGTGQFSQTMYANTAAGQTAQGPKVTFDDKSAIGNTNTDPFVQGAISLSAAAATSNLAASSTDTHSSISLDGGITINTGSNLQTTASEYQTGSIQQYQYQNRSMEIFRQRGDAESPEGVQGNDDAKIHFYMSSNNTGNVGSLFYSYSSSIGAKVDPGFVNSPLAGVPTGVEIGVTNTGFAQIEHNFFGNGDVSFNTTGAGAANPITFTKAGVITAPEFVATGTPGFTGDGSGLTGVTATATPAGFADSIQYNDGGTALGGDSVFTYSSSGKSVALTGAAAGVGGVPTLNIDNGGFNVNQEEIGGGAATFAFNNYYAGGLIAPTTFFRARGTKNSPTQVASGDQIVSEGYYVNSGTGHTYVGAGGQTATVQANDGLGNVAVTYAFATAKPANGPNSLDKILFDTEFTHVAGNITMDNTSSSLVAGRIRQITDLFANLPGSPVTGERAMITDGPTFNYGAVVSAGGGSQVMPVFWDGSDWRQG